MRELEIKTKKNAIEWIIFIGAMLSIIALTIIFARQYQHYCIGIIGFIVMVTNWMKQGVSNLGVLLIARGKELFCWKEIGSVRIRKNDKITIDYFGISGSKIITHNYYNSDYIRILENFEKNNISTKIIN